MPSLFTSPEPLGELEIVGNNGVPKNAFPLDMCMGDCDSDKECVGDLVCTSYDGTEGVPNCSGTGIEGKDYCTNPNMQGEWSGSDPYYKFNLRLYWEQTYFWQETHEETWVSEGQ